MKLFRSGFAKMSRNIHSFAEYLTGLGTED